ncbi:DUF4395 domain-containing protein [Corynebacterium comes]|uniref:DUF4395 domain-containing protein n=1 Tax=Corynebacterium comes TaxID=2675218 RepID=A0A6B8VMV5_9CORY|nr:DUF4395 domain-containing protein [Corynebacterium comes]QGU04449.1 hypothetical protein CETAM_05910 [Corynebacterium comes]
MNRSLFVFPNPVNEYAARCTAGLVVALTAATILSGDGVRLALLVALTLGFALRVAGGPRYSPFGRLSVHVLVPLLRRAPRLTAGPPKRFAQAIGLVVSGTALAFTFAGWTTAATVTLVALVVAATLESAFGFCLGCRIFSVLMRWGVIPEDICEECASVGRRYAKVTPAALTIERADVGLVTPRSGS